MFIRIHNYDDKGQCFVVESLQLNAVSTNFLYRSYKQTFFNSHRDAIRRVKALYKNLRKIKNNGIWGEFAIIYETISSD